MRAALIISLLLLAGCADPAARCVGALVLEGVAADTTGAAATLRAAACAGV